MVEAAQELGTVPEAMQAIGTPPGAPTRVTPGVIPVTVPGSVLGAPCEPKA